MTGRVAHVRGRWVRRAAVVLLAAGAGGCAHYHAQPLHPEATAAAFSARRLDDATLRDAVTPMLPADASWPPQWNRGSLLAVALVNNPGLREARADVDATRAHTITAGQWPNPTIGLQSEYALDDVKPWLYGISLDLPIPTPSQRRLEIELARLGVDASRWTLMDRTWTVRRHLVDDLSTWCESRRRVTLLTTLVADRRQLVAVTQARVDGGEDAPAALAPVQADELAAEQSLAQAQADHDAAQSALAATLGVPPAALDDVVLHWQDWGTPPAVPAKTLDDARHQALLARADLAGAINAYAEAEDKLKLEIARQYPQFSLSPGYYWDHGVHKFPLGVNLTLPLFNHNAGQIAEARAARAAAGAHLLAVQAGIIGGIDAAERAERQARHAVHSADDASAAARQQARRAHAATRLGAADRASSLVADTAVVEAALGQLQAHARLQTARLALEDALHTPLSGPELALRHGPAASSGESP